MLRNAKQAELVSEFWLQWVPRPFATIVLSLLINKNILINL